MIALANFCFAFAATGTAIHMVTHLEHVGYSASDAALAMSFIFGFAAIGKVVMGLIADRSSARWALTIDFVIQAVGIVLIFAIQRAVVAPIFVAVYGLTVAAPLMLLPLLTAESLGLKRFGFICGLTGLAQTFGATIGPLVSGRIFDLANSYTVAFELCIAVNLVGALATFACKAYTAETTALAVIAEPASAGT
jgi:MFS family permease